jgi:CRP/FNR family transcriptional regulator, cyclic AMP receptor protein
MNIIDRTALQSLATVGWLSEQPQDFQARVAAAGRWTTFARGQLLYSEGDEATAVFGLGEGLLDISLPISPEEEVVVYRAPPGFWIGDAAVLAGKTRTVSLTAAVESRVFRLSAVSVRRLLDEKPAYWACFMQLTHRNATLALQVLAEVLALPPRARFARMLLRMASTDGAVHVTQTELGRMAGMSRSALRRALGDLIASGAIAVDYGCLRIVDRPALETAAESC